LIDEDTVVAAAVILPPPKTGTIEDDDMMDGTNLLTIDIVYQILYLSKSFQSVWQKDILSGILMVCIV